MSKNSASVFHWQSQNYAAAEICIQQEYCWYPYRNRNVPDWIFKSSFLIPARHAELLTALNFARDLHVGACIRLIVFINTT